MILPLVFDIGRASGEDGPGLRTVVFLKGCPLQCLWCQNPESQNPDKEVLFNRDLCIKCGNCASECYSLARQTIGQYYSPEILAEMILRDEIFYKKSGGGVTFSGGEPLLYIEYIRDTLLCFNSIHIHTAIETCGIFDFNSLENNLLSKIDLFLFDIKTMDPALHKKWTGRTNYKIIENFKKLVEAGKEILPRIPLIPGYTASEENLIEISQFFKQMGIKKIELLPYNPSGVEKWEKLGKSPPTNLSKKPLNQVEFSRLRDFFLISLESNKYNE